MTTVYFIRHAEPNYDNHNDLLRELSSKGLEDRKLVTAFLADKNIDVILSSPYKRAIDTVRDFAEKKDAQKTRNIFPYFSASPNLCIYIYFINNYIIFYKLCQQACRLFLKRFEINIKKY